MENYELQECSDAVGQQHSLKYGCSTAAGLNVFLLMVWLVSLFKFTRMRSKK